MIIDFQGKYCVITGGGKGIGAAIAKTYLAYGAKGVALLDMDEEGAKATAAELDPDGGRTMVAKCDVGNEASVVEAFAKVHAQFGRVDILVNNAGFTRDAMFHKMTTEQFLQVINVHVNGMFYCTKQVIEGMRAQNYGRIVNMSSMAAFGNMGQSNYSAAKSAVIGMTKTLALEVAAKGITVNCIAPGLVGTDIIKTIPDRVMETLIDNIPMKRIGQVEDVSNLAAFLTSDASSYITGQCILCSGGC
jgi:Dehydrogenases with different specificities (related to short-chain alcohol dehydrogenases)